MAVARSGTHVIPRNRSRAHLTRLVVVTVVVGAALLLLLLSKTVVEGVRTTPPKVALTGDAPTLEPPPLTLHNTEAPAADEGDVTVAATTMTPIPSLTSRQDVAKHNRPHLTACADPVAPNIAIPNNQPAPVEIRVDDPNLLGGQYSLAFEGGAMLHHIQSLKALQQSRVGAGWHCLILRDERASCTAATAAFVVKEKSRGDSEYGVTPNNLGRLPFRVASLGAGASEQRSTSVAPTHAYSVAVTELTRDLAAAEVQTAKLAALIGVGSKRPKQLQAQHSDNHLTATFTRSLVVPVDTPAVILMKLTWPSSGERVSDFIRVLTESALDKQFKFEVDDPHRDPSRPPSFRAEFNDAAVEAYHGWGTVLVLPQENRALQAAAWRGERRGAQVASRAAHTFPHRSGATLDSTAWTISALPLSLNRLRGTTVDFTRESMSVYHAPLSDFRRVEDGTDIETGEAFKKWIGDTCLVHIATSIVIDDHSTIPGGCVIAIDPGVIISVKATLNINGTAELPVIITRAAPLASQHDAEDMVHHGNWGGFTVAKRAVLAATHTIFAFAGGSKKRAKGTGTHIKDACPVVTAEAHSTVQLVSSALVHSKGPGLGAGRRSNITIIDSFFHDLAQGGECVSCDIHIRDSVFANFMLQPQSKRFLDQDNDAFYFRGGHATVLQSAFLSALDDCIDSAASKGDQDVSSLTIKDSVIANCVHEGIALSSSVGTKRDVTVSGSLIAWAQQGVENGHTGEDHTAIFKHCSFVGNGVGVRQGDNFRLAIDGHLHIESSLFVRNRLDVLSAEMDANPASALKAFDTDFRTLKFVRGGDRVKIASSIFEAPHEMQHQVAMRNSIAHQQSDFRVDKEANPGAMTRHGKAVLETVLDYWPPRLDESQTTADAQLGVLCGARHFISEDNTVVEGNDMHAVEDRGCHRWNYCRNAQPL